MSWLGKVCPIVPLEVTDSSKVKRGKTSDNGAMMISQRDLAGASSVISAEVTPKGGIDKKNHAKKPCQGLANSFITNV